eukprot:TRINITY_DN6365_c0_g1_i1.p1 TRINITY_DN6365_c0_g1~~TRINITY_DN6365_c0_g1_i1.p1  ORF type:complete len:391 (+),score=62.99 TRINITY_DN6365_c0_g1_i1:124-1296(+)
MDLDLLSRVLFPRPPISYSVDSFPGELLWVPRSLNPQTAQAEDCIPLCLLQSCQARCLVVYFHSNFEDIGRCYAFCRGLRDVLQVHVLIVEYPAYGICPGDQCDDVLAADCARVALRFVREVLRCPRSSILLMGRSIGTGLAMLLGAEHRYGGLVLICPFLSVKDLVSGYVGPASSFITERFPNKEKIEQVKYPCLFVHGQDDEMIPVSQCQALYDACHARKAFVSPAKMEHNANLLEYPSLFLEPMQRFLQDLPLIDFQLSVPSWCFDKQMCPHRFARAGYVKPGKFSSCWVPGVNCSACGGPCTDSCQSCVGRNGNAVEDKSPKSIAVSLPVMEASIARAVETSLFRPPSEVTSGAGVAKRSSGHLKPMRFGYSESIHQQKEDDIISL